MAKKNSKTKAVTKSTSKKAATKKAPAKNYETLLKSFFKNNPWSKIKDNEKITLEADTGEKQRLSFKTIERPWNDPTFELFLFDGDKDTIDTLNNVILPPSFTGIWHKDTKRFEVIWTAYKLPEPDQEIVGRKFSFSHKGKEIKCEFGVSSNRLLRIAALFYIVESPSHTFFRNLSSFRRYLEDQKEAGIGEPYSFWIDGLEWQEDAVAETVRLLNFYLTYYDKQSPYVVIHSSESEEEKIGEQIRYSLGAFPDKIEAREINNNITDFWLAAQRGNPMLRFLIYFRIIEYSFAEHVDVETRSRIEKVIARPHVFDERTKATSEIISIVNSYSKEHETQRYIKFIKSIVDPAKTWAFVEKNKKYFQRATKFEGGYSVPPLITEKTSVEDFGNTGVEAMARRLREIRNALSHGRDLATDGVITPTNRNNRLITPWLNLVEITAGETILYRDVA